MKKVLAAGVALIFLMLGFAVFAQEEETELLSGMTDEELLLFLSDSGVTIPAQYQNDADCLPFVRNIVEKLEENPNAVFGYGYVHLQMFADSVKAAVLNYYASSLLSTFLLETTPVNILEDSCVAWGWNNYGSANCYAFAIGHTVGITPGDIVDGRDYDGPYLDDLDTPVTEADFLYEARRDLDYLGYSIVYSGTQRPTLAVTEHHRLICFRMESTNSGDFHFMVLEEDGNWYHKPGTSNPLRYLYEPSNDTPWKFEGYNGTYYFFDDDRSYSGTVYYIEYVIPCEEYEYIYLGSGMHILACAECEKTTGSVGFCIYHNGRCTSCGSIESVVQQSVPSCEEGS